MNDFTTFVVIGTINSLYGKFSTEERFKHTLDAIDSIHNNTKGHNVKIVYVDNSIEPIKDEWKSVIESKVTLFHQMEHNLYTRTINRLLFFKSLSELVMLDCAMRLLKKNDLVGKRIFKLSGRYKITEGFDLATYDDPMFKDKYAIKPTQYQIGLTNDMGHRYVWFLEQGLMSLDASLLDEFLEILPGMLFFMNTSNVCIEEAFGNFIPQNKVVTMEKVFVTGVCADNLQTRNY